MATAAVVIMFSLLETTHSRKHSQHWRDLCKLRVWWSVGSCLGCEQLPSWHVTRHTSGTRTETHHVPLWVCVEWRCLVNVLELLVFGEFCQGELAHWLVCSEGVLPGWDLAEERSGIDCHCLHSKSQAVILMEVLGVGSGVLGEKGVGDELTAASTISKLAISHLNYIMYPSKTDLILMMSLVLPPVEQLLNDQITFKWPTQLVVMFPPYEISIDRHMSTLVITMHWQAPWGTSCILVGVCVEWRASPPLTSFFHLAGSPSWCWRGIYGGHTAPHFGSGSFITRRRCCCMHILLFMGLHFPSR